MHKFYSSLLLVSLCFSLNAQSTLGINFNGFIPVGELKKDSPEIWGAGFNMEFAAQLKDTPIHLGGQFGGTRYGSEVRDGYHGPNLGDVRVRRNNEFMNLLGFVRVKPQISGSFQPYVDFHTGFSYILTRANYRDSSLGEPFDSQIDIIDFVFNYGSGAGVEIFINEFVSFDMNIRMIRSSRANYLTPQSVVYDTVNEVYQMEIRNSRFNHLNAGFGMKILLSKLN